MQSRGSNAATALPASERRSPDRHARRSAPRTSRPQPIPGVPYARSTARTARRSRSTPRAQSCHEVHSSGEWLIPTRPGPPVSRPARAARSAAQVAPPATPRRSQRAVHREDRASRQVHATGAVLPRGPLLGGVADPGPVRNAGLQTGTRGAPRRARRAPCQCPAFPTRGPPRGPRAAAGPRRGRSPPTRSTPPTSGRSRPGLERRSPDRHARRSALRTSRLPPIPGVFPTPGPPPGPRGAAGPRPGRSPPTTSTPRGSG